MLGVDAVILLGRHLVINTCGRGSLGSSMKGDLDLYAFIDSHHMRRCIREREYTAI